MLGVPMPCFAELGKHVIKSSHCWNAKLDVAKPRGARPGVGMPGWNR